MSLEERWTDRLQREDERRRGLHLEVKSESDIAALNETCHVPKCLERAVVRYSLGQMDWFSGIEIDLCEEHNDLDHAWNIYHETINEPE